MKTITISISDGAVAVCSDTDLGRAGEHKNTVLHIVITDSSMLSCDYYRCWMGGRYSERLTAVDGQLEYYIPQDALIPPSVDFQLCGYKTFEDEPTFIVRSSVLNFSVSESAGCTQMSSRAYEPYEMISLECGNAAESAKKSELSAALSAQAAEQAAASIDTLEQRIGSIEDELTQKAGISVEQDISILQAEMQTKVGEDELNAAVITLSSKADKTQVEQLSNSVTAKLSEQDEEISSVISKVQSLENEKADKSELSAKADQTELDDLRQIHYQGLTQLQDSVQDKADKTYVDEAIVSAISTKQDILTGGAVQYVGFEGDERKPIAITPDIEPTEESGKLITSDAVWRAVAPIDSLNMAQIELSENMKALRESISGAVDEDELDLRLQVINSNIDELSAKLDSKVDTAAFNEKIGDIEASIDSIIAIQEELIGVISFKVSGTVCKAIFGMTWDEWNDSSYNTIGNVLDGSLGGLYISTSNGLERVGRYDEIIENAVYAIE